MRRTIFKATALVLSLVMMFTMLSACGSSNDADPATDEVVEEVEKAEATGSENSADSNTNSDSSAETDQSEKEVVSVEVYEDCDGSGHGVKVITYADGTQEEVAF